jgi:accessory gene regulator B
MTRDPIEVFSHSFAVKLKQVNPEIEYDPETIAHGLAVKISFYGVILLSLGIALWTGTLMDTAISMIGLKVLRDLTGGRHLPSLTACFIFTILLFTIPPLIGFSPLVISVLNALSLLVILREWRYIKWPLLCICIICANFFIFSGALAVTFTVQAVSIWRR